MEKFIGGIDDLNLGRNVAGGSCSGIYEFGEDSYFKMFDEDYWDLSDSINMEFYTTIKTLSEISGMPFIIRGKDIYRSEEQLFGYSMPIVDALELHSVSDDVLIEEIFKGFYFLRKDIRVLAENYVKTEDVGGDNILSNGSMYLLDLDLSLIDRNCLPSELYDRCVNSVLCGIRGRIFGDERYQDKVSGDSCDEYLENWREVCSEALGRDAKTISDMREGYSKVKKMFKKVTIC